MKFRVKRLFSMLLVAMLLLAQCTFVSTTGVVAAEGGGVLEIIELQNEYRYREPFNAKLRYVSPEGTVYNDITAFECGVSGFNNLAELPEEQEVTIQYMDASITCTVQAGFNRQDAGKYNWGFNEATGELVICGMGSLDTTVPWSEFCPEIRTITMIGVFSYIPGGTFKGCTAVDTINIEEGSRTMNPYAFIECRNVKNIFLPSTLTTIQDNAFYNNPQYQKCVFYPGTQENWDNLTINTTSFANANVYTDYDGNAYFDIDKEYYLNDDFRCELNLTDNFIPIDREYIAVCGFDSSVPGKQMVTVSFGPHSETVIVNVIDPDNPDGIVIHGIYAENVKTAYCYGESFYAEIYADTDDGVREIALEECIIEGFDSTNPGVQRVEIRYGEFILEYEVVVYSESDGGNGVECYYDYDSRKLEVSGEMISMADMADYDEYELWKEEAETLIVRAEHIDSHAFTDFRNLRTVTIENVCEIGSFAFRGCENLNLLYLPMSLMGIGDGAFENCTELREVHYEGDATQWSEIRFDSGNDALQMAEIHYNGEQNVPGTGNILMECRQTEYFVGDRYFYVDVYEEFEDGTRNPIHEDEYIIEGFDTSVSGRVYVTVTYGDYSQEFGIVVLPRDNLTWIYDEEVHELVIEGSGEMGTYECWWDNGHGYTSAPWAACLSDVWSIVIGEEVTSISSGAFVCSAQLERVQIGGTVERIEAFAFDGCTRLTSIDIPDSVTFIGGGAFSGCTALHDVSFGNGLVEISGGGNFYGCALDIINLPDSLTTLGVGAFENCQSLNTVYIPISVTHIDCEAFYNCNNLTDVYYEGTEIEWSNIYIGENNENLYCANIYYEAEDAEPEPNPEPTYEVIVENVKTEYYIGEDFYAEVYLHYSDGTVVEVEDFAVVGFDSDIAGKQVVTITYGEFSQEFEVTVIEETVVEPVDNPKVTVSAGECMPGNTVDVVVSLSGNNGFSNLGLEIEYDTSLKLIAVSENVDVDATFTPAQTLDVYPYNISFDNEATSYFNGNLVTLTFEVPEGTEAGEYFVNVDFYKGRDGNYIDGEDVNYDEDENPLNLSYEGSFVNVYTHVPGDINGDGVVNNKDVTYMLRYLGGWNIEDINQIALDTTGDGRVNNKDGTRLLRYLVQGDVEIY